MENQIKVGSVVTFKQEGMVSYNISFVVSQMDEKNKCLLHFYSPITGKFESYPHWIPTDALVLL